ncbi:MAG: hypothetical protein JNK32_08820 [Anaerolineales bacterium]|nr:hypothetical protein [Anaerolineales bacterium]
MSRKNLETILGISVLLTSMLACNLGSIAPSDSPTYDPNSEGTPSPEISEAPTEAAPIEGSGSSIGACSNPYLPILQGATWDYTLTGPVPDTFTRSIISVEAEGFIDQDVFGTGVTRQGQWKCENGNLIALNPSGGESASVSTEGMSVEYETTAIEGVTLPASINPGDSWSQSLTLEGAQTINGEAFPASNQTTQTCTAAGVESVTIPAGTFDAMRVECQVNMNITLEMSGSPFATSIALTNTNWYAIKVGLVKTVSTGSGLDSTIELTSYSIP